MNCPKCSQVLREGARFCDNCGAPVETQAWHNSAETLRDDPLIGQTLDNKYELLARLGEGGMGVVYRAGRVHIGDEVAVKVLLRKFVADAASVERFRREARAAAKLRHQNVVAIYDYGEARGGDAPAYIVMELLDGTSLRRLLKQDFLLAPERAVSLMRDICAGVGSAHRRGVFHRDLKPDNVIVLSPNEDRERESVKVVDFGIAKLRDPTDAPTLTETGALVGTPHYMSPEQCRGEPLDARSDVYSLGAMFYEMMAGVPPFTAETATGVMAKHLFDPPPRLPAKLGVASAIEEVVMRSLDKDPDARPADAATFARELQEAERRAREEEEEHRRAEEEGRRAEEERLRAEEERRREEELRRAEQERQEIEAERLRLEAEARRAEEDEARRRAEEEQRAREEDERRRREAAAALAAEVQRRREAEERRAEEQRRLEAERRHKAEELDSERLEAEKTSARRKAADAGREVFEAGRAEPEAEEPERVRRDAEELGGKRAADVPPRPPAEERMRRLILIAAPLALLGIVAAAMFYRPGRSTRNVNGVPTGVSPEPAVVASPSPAKPAPPDGMVYVPGGTFLMGRDDGDEYERPAHSVEVKPFFVDTYEVTCADYEKFVKDTDRPTPRGWRNSVCPTGAAHKPVTGVNWDDANVYCRQVGGKRLPTEEEWEFAARGTDGRLYPWGNELKDGMANVGGAAKAKGLADVGTFKGASPFGAFDMVGNAWEWTASSPAAYPGGSIAPLPPGDFRVIRGGSYVEDVEATTTYRGYLMALGDTYAKTGFRCAKDADGSVTSGR